MDKQFWNWANDSNELILEGVIASESWFDDEVTPKMFREQLSGRSGPLTVRINSPGGDVFAGVSIYNMLNEYDGEVTVKVDGLAASIASLVSMAGDKIIMLPGAMMMVHKPWTFATGNADDLTQVVEMLEKTCASMIPIYAERTGQTEAKIEELLSAETWMTGEDAVVLGFATEAEPAKTSLAQSLKNALAFGETVKNAVSQPAMAMLTKLKAQQIEVQEAEEVEETDVTVTTSSADEADTTETDVSKTEAAEKSEDAVEETNETDNGVKMETTQEAIAKAQVLEPAAQAAVDTPNPSDYLKTKASVEDFAKVLRAQAGKNVEDVKAAWKDVLIKNGLADADYFQLPEPVVTSIEDAVKSGEIYSRMNHTGLDVFKVTYDNADADADTSRAGGHAKGDTKDEQVLDFDDRTIRAQYIYKYLVLDKETIRENKSTGALVRFVLNELPVRIVREMERAAIIGDGRVAGTDKRAITSFVSVKSDVVESGAFATSITADAGDSLAQVVAEAADEILADGEVVLIAKKGFKTRARFEKDSNGALIFPAGMSAEDVLGVDTIIEPTWFNDATDPDYDAYLVVLGAYDTVGDNSVEAFTNFKLESNENEFLQEIYKGGALAKVKAAVGITA